MIAEIFKSFVEFIALQPEVIELHVPISEVMSKIQTTILDLMNLTVKELKRINKTLELQVKEIFMLTKKRN